MRKAIACVFLFVAPLLAQSHFDAPETAAAATGPAFEASAGYAYFNMSTPAQRVGLTGLDASALVKFDSHWGATVDALYASTANVLGTGHSANVFSFLAGPVYYPIVHGQTGLFIRALAGASRVESAVPVSGPYYLTGWVARPSYAVGGGVEQGIFSSLAIRVQADYQRTSFGDSAGAIQGQNDLRLSTSMVYRFGNHGSF